MLVLILIIQHFTLMYTLFVYLYTSWPTMLVQIVTSHLPERLWLKMSV